MRLASSSNRGAFPFPVTGNWWYSQLGGKGAVLIAVSRMDPVCLSWGLSCGDQFVRYVLMPGFEGGRISGAGETERKELLLFGAVSWWMFRGKQRVNVS